jgi:hypothetical protein
MSTPMRQVLLAGVPVAALLARLRTPSGDRMPEDVTEIVASFVPRSLAFGSLPFPRSGALSLDEMRERIYRYIVDGETVGGAGAHSRSPEWHPGNFEVLVDYGIEILIFIGLEDRVTLQSIFTPPVLDLARYRAGWLSLNMYGKLAGLRHTWVHDHGPSPAASAWEDEAGTLPDILLYF